MECSLKDISVFTHPNHAKLFQSLIPSKQQINIKHIEKYSFECHYKTELVRFNLKEFISKKVEESIADSTKS